MKRSSFYKYFFGKTLTEEGIREIFNLSFLPRNYRETERADLGKNSYLLLAFCPRTQSAGFRECGTLHLVPCGMSGSRVDKTVFTHLRFSARTLWQKDPQARGKQFVNSRSAWHVGETSVKSNSKLWLRATISRSSSTKNNSCGEKRQDEGRKFRLPRAANWEEKCAAGN